mmetsp:Transcript_4117/g.12772  ORF Transcript_4117/g.12772 Transcript_4117/m.12772 type:complete len:248 (+) Transcript_4117:2786-3529(+)
MAPKHPTTPCSQPRLLRRIRRRASANREMIFPFAILHSHQSHNRGSPPRRLRLAPPPSMPSPPSAAHARLRRAGRRLRRIKPGPARLTTQSSTPSQSAPSPTRWSRAAHLPPAPGWHLRRGVVTRGGGRRARRPRIRARGPRIPSPSKSPRPRPRSLAATRAARGQTPPRRARGVSVFGQLQRFRGPPQHAAQTPCAPQPRRPPCAPRTRRPPRPRHPPALAARLARSRAGARRRRPLRALQCCVAA